MDLTALLREVRGCELCAPHLPHGVRPVLAAHEAARVLIVGQAPGRRVHASGVPWDDPSGVRLRSWLAVTDEEFYDPARIALVPMGFCYPGTGSGGDLPPRPECAATWHAALLEHLPRIELVLLLSRYAHVYYLGRRAKPSVTATVRAWQEYGPHWMPLPHPSTRNQAWWQRNPWFERELVPELRERVRAALA